MHEATAEKDCNELVLDGKVSAEHIRMSNSR
jgi:hypothetical protein